MVYGAAHPGDDGGLPGKAMKTIPGWTALGGPDRRLVPICRNADSAVRAVIDWLTGEEGRPSSPARAI